MKTKLIVVFCLMFALLSSAFAVTVSDVSLDVDDAVERSNPILEGSDNELDRDDELEYVSFSIPVKADSGDVTVTALNLNSGFTYKTLTDDNDNDDIFLIGTTLPLTIPNGTTSNVDVKILVPSNLDSVGSNYKPLKHSVDVTVVNNEASKTAKLSFYVENGLELSDVEILTSDEKIDCDVEIDQTDLDCDDEIEELKPSENFDLSFTIENIFDSDSDLDIDDVEIDLDSDDKNVDIDDDSMEEDINAEDTFSESILFEVDDDVEDGDKVTITITVSGEDENGAKHGFEYTFDVQFEVADYEVVLNSVDLSPGTVCQGETARVLFEVENVGGKDQKNVRVQIKNNALGLNEIIERIELEDEDSRDNDYSGAFTIPTSDSTRANKYDVEFIVFYRDEDTNDATLFERLDLIVQDCTPGEPSTDGGQTQNPPQGQQPPVVVVQPTNPPVVEPTPTQTAVTATVTKKGSASIWAIGGLVVVILVILILIGLIVAVLRK